jgi:hypothetical protein
VILVCGLAQWLLDYHQTEVYVTTEFKNFPYAMWFRLHRSVFPLQNLTLVTFHFTATFFLIRNFLVVEAFKVFCERQQISLLVINSNPLFRLRESITVTFVGY